MRSLLFRRALSRLALAAASAVALAAFAGPAQAQNFGLFTLTDPRGDDAGSGDLLYPDREDFQPGDLDLLSLTAESDKGGTWFTATFASPIRKPGERTSELGPERLDRVARLGFYTFNLDLYIDTDRKPGSGNTATVPGRGVQVDRRDAWEKAVILTPRPDVARQLLLANAARVLEEQRRAQVGQVTGADQTNIQKSLNETFDQRYFFPTKVQVNQREIRFFVPDQFLTSKANPAWAYTAFVTGAVVEPRQRVVDMPFKDDGFSLLTIPVAFGRKADAFGLKGSADPGQPAIVDILHSDGALQPRMLRDYDAVSGRMPKLVGMVPTGRNQSAFEPYSGPAAVARAPGQPAQPGEEPKAYTPSAKEAAAALSGAPILPGPAADLATPAPSAPGTSAPAAPGGAKTVAQRLRELTELRQQNLVTEEEYQDARRRILSGV
ncbi:MAG TPA: glucodextranase DOMON-like domain-containing protein [Azospirillaceae bacterium]|nr:glucodextranase DOMON-like domain-containing protein [Azospirillaceae bacterium]